jgi:hypothetical protein
VVREVFVETQQHSGAETALFNYNRLGNTTKTIAVVIFECSEKSAPCQLDDTVKIDTAKSVNSQKFTDPYKQLCKDIGIQLVANCPNK